MTTQLADFLKKASDHCGHQDLTIREGYSGRGMIGRRTVGVVVDSVPELLLNVIQYIKEQLENNPTQVAEKAAEHIPFVADANCLSTDNMGHSTILY